MLLSIRNMLDSLHAENIVYCHWKSNQHLERAVNGGTDLDMLFKPSQREAVEKILNECGLKRFRATPMMQYNAIEDFIGFDKETAKIWHLHLHYRLTLGEKHLKGYTTPWTDYILANRIYNPELKVYCSGPEDEYFLIMLRIALKLRWRDYGRKLGQDDIIEIGWLKERTQKHQVIEIAKKHLGDKCAQAYGELLSMDLSEKRDLFQLQRLLRSSMKQFTAFNAATSYFRRTWREIFWLRIGINRKLGLNQASTSRRVSPAGGAVVALLGCDGAGKSTTLDYLMREFSKKIDVINVYMGSGDGSSSILRYPLRLVAKKVRGKGLGRSIKQETYESIEVRQQFKAQAYGWARIIWAVVLALEKKNKLKTITKARNNGILVLVDRYPQVEIMDYNDGPLLTQYTESRSPKLRSIANWEIAIYRSAYRNPPDLVVKLMVPPEVAIERKPEMTITQIERKTAAIKKIDLSPNSVEIDTTQDRILSFGQVMEQIWKII